MSHKCHAHGCPAIVPPALFMCRIHWFSLRKPLRDAIWRHYVPGQENTKTPTASYMAVQQRAVGELAFKPNDERAAIVAAPYMLNSEVWRAMAIAKGQGDPLEGLTEQPPRSLDECRQAVAAIKAARPSRPMRARKAAGHRG